MANLSDNTEFKKIVDTEVAFVVGQLSTTNTRGRIDIQISLAVKDNGEVEATVSTVSRALNSNATDVGPVGNIPVT